MDSSPGNAPLKWLQSLHLLHIMHSSKLHTLGNLQNKEIIQESSSSDCWQQREDKYLFFEILLNGFLHAK